MGFIIRSVFWLSLVLLIIPFGGASNGEDGTTVGPIEAFFAAREAVGDVAGICERKPEVCDVGRSALETIGIRARESARIAYDVLDEHFSKTDAPAQLDESIKTGTVAVEEPKAEVPAPNAAHD
ncbi:DUF5330 domain-containing protein [Aquamicrobium sp. LC103]|uniref:DUF5330 domain-containing protein n=1 Tax=Aquamicrobium sp. LC103 TaxID=1120658 RepID=UPI00063E803B|nr:DUF5330 domain-containing protein [Aquamicrobium sp. LC103]TKT81214.1 hypothetical protein XW59_004920 [Aquamicrobium sp. LC103]